MASGTNLQYGWAIAVGIAVGANLMSNIGINLQKLALIKKAANFPMRLVGTLWVMGFIGIIGGALCDFAALGFGAQSIVAPLGSISVVANVVVAPMILGEVPTRRDIMATGLIVAGCAVAVSFAAHKDHLFTATQLFALYLKPNFYVYFTAVVVIVLVWLLAIRWMEVIQATRGSNSKAYRRVFKCHRLSYAAISGIAGAQSVLFAKTTVELVTDAIAGGGAVFLTYVPTYAVILAMACTITLQIYWLNCGLARWDALYNVPIFSSFWILCSVIGGGVFYDEFADFSALQGFLFPLGVLLAIGGVYWLSQREATGTPVDDTGWSGRTKLLEGDAADFVAKAKATIRTAQVSFTSKHLGLGLMRLSAKLVDVANPRRSRVAQVWAVWSMTSEAADAIASACGGSRRVQPGDLLVAVNSDSLLDRWTSHTDGMRRIMNTARPVRLGFRILSNAQRRRVLHGRMNTFAPDRPLHTSIVPSIHTQADGAATAGGDQEEEEEQNDDDDEYNIKSMPSREGEREWSASFAAGATVDSSVTQARHAAELSSTYTPASSMAARRTRDGGVAVPVKGSQRSRAASGAHMANGSPPRRRAGTAVAALGGGGGVGGSTGGGDEMVVAAAAVDIGLLLGQRADDDDEDEEEEQQEEEDASVGLLSRPKQQITASRVKPPSRTASASAFRAARSTDEAKASLLRPSTGGGSAGGSGGGYGTLESSGDALTHDEEMAMRARETAQDSDDPDCGILDGWGRGGEFDDASSKLSGASPTRKASTYQRPSLRLSDAGIESNSGGGRVRALAKRRRARAGSASSSAIGAHDTGTSIGGGHDEYIVALNVDDGRLATSAARGIRTAHHALRNVVMDPMMGVFHIGGLVAPFAIFSQETEDEEAGADAGSGGEHPLASLMDRLFPTEGRQWNSLDRLLETLGVGDDDDEEALIVSKPGDNDAVTGRTGAPASVSRASTTLRMAVAASGGRGHSPLTEPSASGAAWNGHRSISDYKPSDAASLTVSVPAQSRQAAVLASRQHKARRAEAIRRVSKAIERVGLRAASPVAVATSPPAVFASQSPRASADMVSSPTPPSPQMMPDEPAATSPSGIEVAGGSATPGGLELHAMHHASSSSPGPTGWKPQAGAEQGDGDTAPTRARRASVGDKAAAQWARRRGGSPVGATSAASGVAAAASSSGTGTTQLDSLAQMRHLQTMVGRGRARSAGFGLEASALINVLCDGTRASVGAATRS